MVTLTTPLYLTDMRPTAVILRSRHPASTPPIRIRPPGLSKPWRGLPQGINA